MIAKQDSFLVFTVAGQWVTILPCTKLPILLSHFIIDAEEQVNPVAVDFTLSFSLVDPGGEEGKATERLRLRGRHVSTDRAAWLVGTEWRAQPGEMVKMAPGQALSVYNAGEEDYIVLCYVSYWQ